MKWITRERPKIDRIACPWLIKNFVDKEAEFIYVPADKVKEQASALNATPGDAATFSATIAMLDYHTQQPITLNCLMHVKECKNQKHTAIYIEVSPKPLLDPVWKKMNQIGDSFDCTK